MAVASQDRADRADRAATGGGALVALTGALLLLVLFLGIGGSPVLARLADVALALGAILLAFGPGGGVGSSWIGRIALVVFGIGPLVFLLPLGPGPFALPLGMSSSALVTIATVVATVSVARSGVLHGVARWALVAVAADALLTAAMSTVQLGALPSLFSIWHLELIRPAGLLVWGLSIVWQHGAPTIRARAAAVSTAWKRSTEVGGMAEPAVDPDRRP